VNGLPMGWHEEEDVSGTFTEMFAWARLHLDTHARGHGCEGQEGHARDGEVSGVVREPRLRCL
jgi:hypothetical protein